MDYAQSNESQSETQQQTATSELANILDLVDASALLERLEEYRWTGRKGYPLSRLWRAYLASFVLNMVSTNELIRRLQDDVELRLLCGFSQVPHRTTFNRFIARLAIHRDLVEQCIANLTEQMKANLPGFGMTVAVDSTVVRTHSNPNRNVISDPEASWTKKHSARAKDGEKEWYFGYKYHAMSDAVYGVPLIGYTTTAKRSDSPELPKLMDTAKSTHGWFRPQYVIADKGYDAMSNYRAVLNRDATPVIAIRDMPKGKLREGIYTNDGTPTCIGQVPMEYVRSDPQMGHLYRCPRGGCALNRRQGVRYCHDEVWENRTDNPRVFGPIRRGSDTWKTLYRLRQSIERVFKSLKEFRRLERHNVRGLDAVSLHTSMSVLAFQATALTRIRAGNLEHLRWMVREVA